MRYNSDSRQPAAASKPAGTRATTHTHARTYHQTRLTNLSRRRHYKLDEDVIAKMREYAASGAALEHIAPAIGVSYCSLKNWLSNARGDNPTELELDLLAAYNEGRAAGALKFASLIHKAAEQGDARSAQWMLTHSPHYRRHYSDSAAERRAFRDGLELAAAAAAEAGLSPEQERKLLLHLQAKSGEQLQAADEAS